MPPIHQDKPNPLDIKTDYLDSLPWRKDDETLSSRILGISPFFSKEIVNRAKRAGSLSMVFLEFLRSYRNSEVQPFTFEASPSISRSRPGIGIVWYKPSIAGLSKIRPASSLNKGVEAEMEAYIDAVRLGQQRNAVANLLKREIRKCESEERKAQEALKDKQASARFRRLGELIIANLTRIRKGCAKVEIPDIYSRDGKKVVIQLEPRLSPQANAEALFKKARKAQRRAEFADQRLNVARERLNELHMVLHDVQADVITTERLNQIEERLSSTLQARRGQKRSADEKASRLGIRPRTYAISDGWRVLVGRSALENDILTHRLASPSDIWFHARQAQGCHVILRRGRKKTQPSRQAILDAARIAAYYSKARTSKHVPVSYTEKRYVKKVRKGPPGMCVMLREKVVFVEPGLPEEG